jgi:hypothetical protein
LDQEKEEIDVVVWCIEGGLVGGSSGNGIEGFQDVGWQGSRIYEYISRS